MVNRYFPKENNITNIQTSFDSIITNTINSSSQKPIINFANFIHRFKKIKEETYKGFCGSFEEKVDYVG